MSSLCTLEFDARELKVLEAKHGHIQKHVETVLPEGAYQDGLPTRVFGEFLARTLQAAEIKGKRARIAISDAGIAVRDFRLPRMPRDELVSAITYEAKRLIPMDPADVYYAWHGRRLRDAHAIYLVAARREMIDAIIAALAAVGLQVERLELKAYALARGAAAADGLVLDLGIGEATLVLMVDARPRFLRTLLLDTPEGDVEAQFEELLMAVNALVKFIRSSEVGLPLDASTPLYLAGRFAVLANAERLAREKFPFAVRWPALNRKWPADFPWQVHLTGIGLLQDVAAERRIAPGPGDSRVAV